jgi:hypothetical protein
LGADRAAAFARLALPCGAFAADLPTLTFRSFADAFGALDFVVGFTAAAFDGVFAAALTAGLAAGLADVFAGDFALALATARWEAGFFAAAAFALPAAAFEAVRVSAFPFEAAPFATFDLAADLDEAAGFLAMTGHS